MLMNCIRTTFAVAALLTVAAPTFAADAHDGMKMPATIADHEMHAKMYREQAAQYRKTAQDHKAMAEAYKATLAPAVKGQPNPWGVKMSKHCALLAADAEKMAVDSDKAAEYHTFRAKELQGK